VLTAGQLLPFRGDAILVHARATAGATAVYLNPLIPEILDHELSWRDAVLAALYRFSGRHTNQVIRRQDFLGEELEHIVFPFWLQRQP
jgi:hypothetical protein